MAAFQFPDPAVQTTVTNPITGSTYQWKEPPGKWVVTVKMRDVGDIIWEGDTPPNPIGDYKLWYSTDTLELYFYYCDAAGTCAWVPTSVPITALEELTEFATQAELDIDQLQYKQQLLQVALDDIYLQVQSGVGNRPPIFGPTEPDKHPDYAPPEDELIAGDIWYDNTDPDNLEQYIYDGSHWVVYGGQFVHRKGGDEMEGPLKILNNPALPGSRDARRIETYGVFSGSDTTALRFGTTRDRIYVGHDDTSFNGLVKIDRIAEKNAGNSVKFENDIKMGINQIKNLAEATDDKDAVTYGQVKEELEELRDKIVGEVSIGTWKFDNISSGVTPLAGCFITKKDSNPPQLSPNDINVIRISDEDVNGNPGVFDWEIGDLLTFTNVNNTTQSIKFRVNSTPANSGSYWIVSVAHVTSNYDFFQNAEYYLSHISIDVSVDVNALDDTYLRLDCSNDPLETELTIQTPDFGEAALSLIGKRDNLNNATATVAFKSQFDTNENYAGYLTYRTTGTADGGYFRFNRDVDLNNNGLHSVARIRIQSGGYIGSGSSERIIVRNADTDNAGTQINRVGDNKRTFSIKGKPKDSNSVTDFFWAYANAGSVGDAINYTGKITNPNNIVNKEYVDSKMPTYTITKSNGNYYVQ